MNTAPLLHAHLFLLTMWAACTPSSPRTQPPPPEHHEPVPPTTPSDPTEPTDSTTETPFEPGGPLCLTDPDDCIDSGALEPLWRLESGYELRTVQVIEDVTGDGAADAVVALWGPSSTFRSLVAGPLVRELDLPSGEFARLEGEGLDVRALGDVTGDGEADLLVHYQAGATFDFALLPGPFEGVVDPATDAARIGLGDDLSDLDGDGQYEYLRVEGYGTGTSIWFGGDATRWLDGAPDLLVHGAGCGITSHDEVHMAPIGDIGGDGTTDLVGGTSSGKGACDAFLIPADLRGEVGLTTHPAVTPVPGGAIGRMPDLNGDGLADYYIHLGWGETFEYEYLAAPLTVNAGAWDGEVALTPHPSLTFQLRGLDADLDGDGIMDVYELSYLDPEGLLLQRFTVQQVGDGIRFGKRVESWREPLAFSENGVAYWLFINGTAEAGTDHVAFFDVSGD